VSGRSLFYVRERYYGLLGRGRLTVAGGEYLVMALIVSDKHTNSFIIQSVATYLSHRDAGTTRSRFSFPVHRPRAPFVSR
jgi:hypothetical protein